MNKKMIVTGATGLIGRNICGKLIQRGDDVIVFSRNVEEAKNIIKDAKEYVQWDYTKPTTWGKKIDGVDAVIHLAGASVNDHRWNDKYKKSIYESRIDSTNQLVTAISKSAKKPEVFICSSAVGYYGDSGNTILTEVNNAGNDFLSYVCKAWEKEASTVIKYGVRNVNIRTGIVLSKNGGALVQMLLPFKLFIGGPLGSGKQWFPWIHIEDIVNLYLFALDNHRVSGVINGTAPKPVQMKEFAKSIGHILKRPSIFPVPKFIIKFLFGEMEVAILGSQRAVPQKAIDLGYKFLFEDVKSALKNILG